MDTLPPLPFWQARSFWLTMIAAAMALASGFGFDLLGALGAESDSALADHIMELVGGAAAILAWRERLSPTKRLTLGG
jgi:hypothetical protein